MNWEIDFSLIFFKVVFINKEFLTLIYNKIYALGCRVEGIYNVNFLKIEVWNKCVSEVDSFLKFEIIHGIY